MKHSSFRSFKTSPEIIRRAVMLYTLLPLPFRNVEDLLLKRGIEVGNETVRFWLIRFGPLLAGEIRGRRVEATRAYCYRQWHLDEMFVKITG